MNILAIGNSFSQDATRYLHQIARADHQNLTVVNLYIGGCPLSLHYRNMLSDEKNYSLEFNGYTTGFAISLKEALLSRDWDYVSFQQASGLSFDYSTYQPYLSELSSYVKKCIPKAKQIIHQTWAYEQGSEKLSSVGYENYLNMFCDVKAAYKKASESINADLTIPSGELFCKLLSSGIDKIHRDTFHARCGIGRYSLGLLWYAMLTENKIDAITYDDFDEAITDEELQIAVECINKIISDYKN